METNKFFIQATNSLEAYHKRGKLALSWASQDHWEKAEEFLKHQKFAFHNFRISFAMLTEEEKNYLRIKFRKLWDNIKEQDQELQEVLCLQREFLKTQKQKIMKEKSVLKKYLSPKNVEVPSTASII